MEDRMEKEENRALSDEEAEQVTGGTLASGTLPLSGSMMAGGDVTTGSQVYYGDSLPVSGSQMLKKKQRGSAAGRTGGLAAFFRFIFGRFFR